MPAAFFGFPEGFFVFKRKKLNFLYFFARFTGHLNRKGV